MADEEATGWFEPLYAAARAGRGAIPWDAGEASPHLADWLPEGHGDAAVVGCGTGEDAALVAARGWTTTAFDIAPTAVALAKERHPDAPVAWELADLLDLPTAWRGRFDLVVEHFTVQALPVSRRPAATAAVASLVAPGGTLIVLTYATDDASPDRPGPPWPLTRAEIDAFAAGPLATRTVEALGEDGWRAVFDRAAPPGAR